MDLCESAGAARQRGGQDDEAELSVLELQLKELETSMRHLVRKRVFSPCVPVRRGAHD